MSTVLYIVCGLSLTTTILYADAFRTLQLLSKSVEEFSGRIIPDIIRQRTSGTTLYCQMLCLRDEECMSFFHNSITGICQTHGVIFFNPNDGQLSPGSLYYRQVQEFCPADIGYIFNRALDFCYKFHYLNPGDYDHARRECQGEGGDLVITDTKEKFDHIGLTIGASTFPPAKYAAFLIGATDVGYATKDWHWYNGQQVIHNRWNWCSNQNTGFKYHYIAMNVSNACVRDVTFSDKYFVCERHI